jgi:hypothetical protein
VGSPVRACPGLIRQGLAASDEWSACVTALHRMRCWQLVPTGPPHGIGRQGAARPQDRTQQGSARPHMLPASPRSDGHLVECSSAPAQPHDPALPCSTALASTTRPAQRDKCGAQRSVIDRAPRMHGRHIHYYGYLTLASFGLRQSTTTQEEAPSQPVHSSPLEKPPVQLHPSSRGTPHTPWLPASLRWSSPW